LYSFHSRIVEGDFAVAKVFSLGRIKGKDDFMITEKDNGVISLLARQYGMHKVLLISDPVLNRKKKQGISIWA
jgi:hypothetical protein